MVFPTFSYIGAFFSLILAIYILIRDWRVFVHRIFALGMTVLALEAAFGGFSFSAASSEEILKWEFLRITISSFLPGIWLIFALSLGQKNYKENIKKWRWVLLPMFLIPIALVIIFKNQLFINGASAPIISKGLLPIGWPTKSFYIVFLISAVLILACLERTLRATSGATRWQVKFMILGLASISALRIYTGSQVLLYSMLDVSENTINNFGLIAGNTLMAISFIRMPKIILTIYPSQSFLYNSVVILIIGIYLIIVGVLAKIIHFFGYTQIFPFSFLFIFLAITLLATFILSEKVRQKIREFISRHLVRSRYDYREQWREFTKRTSSIIDIDQLSKAVTNFIADTFGVSTASIWLLYEKKGGSA
ncbi:MAG: histidine kinase N-terminal 7TM domain-containing protein [Thermodesulfobacteriota bacterium]